MAKPANLASTWLALCLEAGQTRAHALRRLNAVTQTQTTHSRLCEWIREDRHPGPQIRMAMLIEVLPSVLADFGVELAPDAISDLAEALA